jgi:hypothetical protein
MKNHYATFHKIEDKELIQAVVGSGHRPGVGGKKVFLGPRVDCDTCGKNYSQSRYKGHKDTCEERRNSGSLAISELLALTKKTAETDSVNQESEQDNKRKIKVTEWRRIEEEQKVIMENKKNVKMEEEEILRMEKELREMELSKDNKHEMLSKEKLAIQLGIPSSLLNNLTKKHLLDALEACQNELAVVKAEVFVNKDGLESDSNQEGEKKCNTVFTEIKVENTLNEYFENKVNNFEEINEFYSILETDNIEACKNKLTAVNVEDFVKTDSLVSGSTQERENEGPKKILDKVKNFEEIKEFGSILEPADLAINFLTSNKALLMMDKITKQKSFLCQECGTSFQIRSKFKNHIYSAHKTKFCKLCSKNVKHLKDHKRTEHSVGITPKESLECSQCNKIFKKHSYL